MRAIYRLLNWSIQPANRAARLRSQSGQSLIEYLILVALMGVGTIGIVRTLSKAVDSSFTTVIHKMQGDPRKGTKVDVPNSKKKDMGNFFEGSASRDE
jgi:Flp pilus assembly pilin Flp